ncbi:MAG: hypothetical protein V1743_02785 [Nanoarchaeota archaeon]
MTQKLWQTKPKLIYSNEVIDIVQFGSSVMENSNPNDIDVAVIFSKITLKEQLQQSQQIKKQIEKLTSIPIHISSYDYYSLFDRSNFAKGNILLCGRSIIHGKYLAELFGFIPVVQIFYTLENLEKKNKIKFNYMLNGKKGEYGLLRKYGGKLVKPGLIEIAPEYGNLLLEPIKKFSSSCIQKSLLQVVE